MAVIISQSGETADTLAALRECKERGVRTIGIVNVVGSSIAREADATLYTWAGPEIAVATTKAYSTQLAACYLLAVEFARVRDHGRPFDFGRVSSDYAKYRDIYPQELYRRLRALEIGQSVQQVSRHIRQSASILQQCYTVDECSAAERRKQDRKSTRLNSSHSAKSRMPSSA